MHQTCEDIIATVDGTGACMREVRELTEKIEAEQNKNMGENVKRISEDLRAMKKENAGLVAQLRNE